MERDSDVEENNSLPSEKQKNDVTLVLLHIAHGVQYDGITWTKE